MCTDAHVLACDWFTYKRVCTLEETEFHILFFLFNFFFLGGKVLGHIHGGTSLAWSDSFFNDKSLAFEQEYGGFFISPYTCIYA